MKSTLFLIKLFFLYDQNVGIKIQISWEQKELLTWSKIHFSSLFKELSLNKMKHFFLEGESSTLMILIPCEIEWRRYSRRLTPFCIGYYLLHRKGNPVMGGGCSLRWCVKRTLMHACNSACFSCFFSVWNVFMFSACLFCWNMFLSNFDKIFFK